MSNVKKKYRLLFLLLLPLLVLSFFIIKFILDDYKQLIEFNKSLHIANLSDKIGNLIDSFEDEITYSNLKDKNDFDRQLEKAREQTNESFENFTNALRAEKTSFENKSLGEDFQKEVEKFNSLQQKRNELDKGLISAEELKNYYEAYITDILIKYSNIGQYITNTELYRSLITYIALLEIRNEFGVLRNIIFSAALEKNLSAQNYKDLLLSYAALNTHIDTFYELGDPDQSLLLRNTFKAYSFSEANRIIESLVNKEPNASININPEHWWDIQTSNITALKNVENKFKERNSISNDEIKKTLKNNILFTILTILGVTALTIYLAYINLRNLTKKLEEEIGVLATSGKEILTAVSQASSSTAETAAAVTETTTTVEELKQTAQIASEKAQHVSDLSNQALDVLQKSEDSLSSTIEDMKRIQSGMGNISENIIKLSEHGQTIGLIIDTVNDLAEQSHLLAVNAAIEAAKAGDQGRGFAVVAQEVRSLAEQSKQATVQVRNILEHIQNATSAAVMSTEKGSKAVVEGMKQSTETTNSIRSLSNEISQVVQAAGQIAVASQQQLVGVEQVNIAMSNIKDASVQQVDHMKLIESSMKGLNDVGQTLQELVKEYRL